MHIRLTTFLFIPLFPTACPHKALGKIVLQIINSPMTVLVMIIPDTGFVVCLSFACTSLREK
jgi:hypothetical protein